MVKTYGGRGAEGAENGVFNVPVSEVIYWKKFRETSFWDSYVEGLRIDKKIHENRPERREKTRKLVKEYFDENPRLS